MATGVELIDWSRPWLDPWRDCAQAVASAVASGQPVHRALDCHRGASAVRFVAADAAPAQVPYERFVRQTASVPTRGNLHDFFNGLAWIRFPATKARINELHAAEIARDGVRGERGPLRDALTLLDESGAFLVAPALLCERLARRDWHALFVQDRGLWQSARIVIFGHALLEKLVSPRKEITAHVICLPRAGADDDDDDARMAAAVQGAFLRGKPFFPLPVLGIPGWDERNGDPGFYDDTGVFRSGAGARHLIGSQT